MFTQVRYFILFISLCCSLPPTFSKPPQSNGDINWWCNTTPHPYTCEHLIGPQYRHRPPKHKSDFRKMMVQVAMQRALSVHRHPPDCKTKPQKAAWTDCFNLYQSTILNLNRSLIDSASTVIDIQTWLSASLTNIHTCLSGSEELKVSSGFISPLANNNLTELLSNSLAVNAALVNQQQKRSTSTSTYYYRQGFPNWVSREERNLLVSSSLASLANIVVAKDGSGNFTTIQEAINVAATRSDSSRFIIHVKGGIYKENIQVGNNVNNITLVGDGLKYTIITGNRSVQGGYTTYNSATAGIDGLNFMARGITFANTAGPRNGQAVALRSGSDQSVFYECAFQGYQDTLLVHSQRQFYRNSYIYGTIDFIFGNAAVVLQNCTIFARKPLQGQANVITAQGRDDPNQNTGISIHNCRVMAAMDLQPVISSFKTYLGRPWKQYSRTVYLKTYLDSLVHPMGWSAWGNTSFALNTLYFGEYKNYGPRSSTKWRVRWRGFRVINSTSVASKFTVASFIVGRSWLPATGVPFTSSL